MRKTTGFFALFLLTLGVSFFIVPNGSAEKTFTNSIGMKFVLIPAGTFMMGSPSDEPERQNDERQHRVTLSKGFYMQTTEITQGQWRSIMGTRPWSGKKYVRDSANNPAVYISWNDCQDFIRSLNQKEGTNKYRLPTEAEWEYACRAGSTTKFCFGESDSILDDYAWFDEDYAHTVGSKKPNAWGLYDMHGNVWEWCQDWKKNYPSGHITDPKGPSSGEFRAVRGGWWGFGAKNCRSANRFRCRPDLRNGGTGLRVAMSLPEAGDQRPVEKYIEQSDKETFINSIGMRFIYIPPGTFMMGSPLDDPGRRNDESQHRVTLSKGFYMQTTEVTQGQWESIMGAHPWSGKEYVRDNVDCPAIYISWNDCQDFIRSLNQKEGTNKYRLPTEAEWEYACRAGSTAAFASGGITELICGHDPNLDAIGWYCGNSDDKTHPVAQKDPNNWGLYDMHGNVFEWCQDYGYGDYPSGHVTDPKGPSSGYRRVLRGGDSYDAARWCRSGSRNSDDPSGRGCSIGFRVARDF